MVASSVGRDVHVIQQPNRGPAAARNAGLGVVRTSYVGFLDADDELFPAWAERTVEALDRGASVAVGDAEIVDEAGNVVRRYYEELQFPPAEDQSWAIYRENFVLSTACVKVDVLRRVGSFDISRFGVEDWELWMRIIRAGGKVTLVPEVLSLYRRGHASLSARVPEMKREELRLLRDVAATPLDRRQRRECRRSLRHRRASLRKLEGDQSRASSSRKAALAYLEAGLISGDWRLLAKAIVVAALPRRSKGNGAGERT